MYLLFDLVHRVGEEDGRCRVRGTHLGLWTLECREEGGVKEGRFVETKARSNVTSHTEIGILRREGRGEGENETQHYYDNYTLWVTGSKTAGHFHLYSKN